MFVLVTPVITVMTVLCNISFVQIVAQITEFVTDSQAFALVMKDFTVTTVLYNIYFVLTIARITESAIV